jgi:hypothetical protein
MSWHPDHLGFFECSSLGTAGKDVKNKAEFYPMGAPLCICPHECLHSLYLYTGMCAIPLWHPYHLGFL